MGIIQRIKKLFTVEQRMARVSMETLEPVHDRACLQALNAAAAKSGLVGWISMTSDGHLKAEFEGAHDVLKEFFDRVEKGQILKEYPQMNIMWSGYRREFKELLIRK